MRNSLSTNGPRLREASIINLDDRTGRGTYWVAYRKNWMEVTYSDSFGNLKPPKELIKYLGVDKLKYNRESYQNFDTFICGHLC